MNNRKKQKIIRLFIFLLGVSATLMIFFPALILQNYNSSFTGFQIAFGHSIANLGNIVAGKIKPNIITVLAYLLPTLAALSRLFLKKGFLIANILFATAAFLFLLLPEYTTLTITIFGSTTEVDVKWNLAWGAQIAAVLSILGLFIGLINMIEKKK